MKDLETCLDDIHDDEYWYLTAFESIKDEDMKNGILRRLYHSAACKDAGLALSNCQSLQIAIDDEVKKEAHRLSEKPDPFYEPVTEFDVRKYA